MPRKMFKAYPETTNILLAEVNLGYNLSEPPTGRATVAPFINKSQTWESFVRFCTASLCSPALLARH